MKFTKVLIANRGEISCRITKACHALGIKSVAVYSEADQSALHVKNADESVLIGPPAPAESYLNIPKIIDAAMATGSQAVHPGYGFLSERETFARAVLNAGLVWIGPKPEVIELMGNKVAAKLAAEKAKVPTLPWQKLSDGWSKSDLEKGASKIGYPLLLKAAAGGGGRGMRLVEKNEDLLEKAESAMREAQGAFGSGEMFIEKYCPVARHIEVQIMGDSQGNIMIFGERDCSAQRRHQKVIEETPAPGITEKTRKKLWDAARSLAKSVSYENAGTCEFIVDFEENIFFLEMNTRLQVEHPVSEIVWGTDLPVLQLKVAQGETIPKEVLSASPRGHAIEARIYAEDPSKGFMPSPGKITDFYFPEQSGIRLDTGYETGSEVTVYYDAMLAKIIAWADSREDARNKLVNTLKKSNVSGLAWNGNFLIELLENKKFKEGQFYTKYIEEAFSGWKGVVKTEPRSVANNSLKQNNFSSPWMHFGDGSKQSIFKSHTRDAIDYVSDHDELLISGPLTSEYPGKILKINVKTGDRVTKGQVVVVCESMKMEFSYSAPADSKVKSIHVEVGKIIQAGALLVEWDEE